MEADTESESILIPFCDFHFDRETCELDADALAIATPKEIPFFRSFYEIDENGDRQQINTATAFLDGGCIYGHTAETANQLRSYVQGKLLTYNDALPLNTMMLDLPNPAKRESAITLRYQTLEKWMDWMVS